MNVSFFPLKAGAIILLMITLSTLSFTQESRWELMDVGIVEKNHRVWSIKIAKDKSIWMVSTLDAFPPTGEEPIIYRLADEGESWIKTSIPEARSNFSLDISPIDSLIAFATFADLGIFKTEDGGVSWYRLENYPYQAAVIHFFDPFDGWVLGSDSTGTFLMGLTEDGGQSWKYLGRPQKVSADFSLLSYQSGDVRRLSELQSLPLISL